MQKPVGPVLAIVLATLHWMLMHTDNFYIKTGIYLLLCHRCFQSAIITLFYYVFFRICSWVLPVVPRGSDPGQPGPADGLDPEHRSGRSGHRVLPEAFCCCQPAGYTQRNPPAGQRTSVTPFLSVCRRAGVATRIESCLRQPRRFHCL